MRPVRNEPRKGRSHPDVEGRVGQEVGGAEGVARERQEEASRSVGRGDEAEADELRKGQTGLKT